MRQFRVLSALVLAALCATACGGSSAPAAPSPPVPPATATSPWLREGVHLTEVTAGLPGKSIADTATIQLNDGRWRTYFTGDHQIRSAISPDGLNMTIESGIRLVLSTSSMFGPTSLASAVKVMRLDDGRIRMYFDALSSMYSAVSTDDGVTFTIESGVRIAASAIGEAAITGAGAVVRAPDGRWRMYFSGNDTQRIFSAVSTDLLSWSVESGVRVGGTATVGGFAEHPSAIVVNGVVSLFYFCRAGSPKVPGLYSSNSTDGLTFLTESAIGITDGADPDLVRSGSTIRMYFNWGAETNGTIQSARFTGTTLASMAPPAASFLKPGTGAIR